VNQRLLPVGNVLGDAIGEILLLRIARHIDEWQHGDEGLAALRLGVSFASIASFGLTLVVGGAANS
jgi:hypothetical protein